MREPGQPGWRGVWRSSRARRRGALHAGCVHRAVSSPLPPARPRRRQSPARGPPAGVGGPSHTETRMRRRPRGRGGQAAAGRASGHLRAGGASRTPQPAAIRRPPRGSREGPHFPDLRSTTKAVPGLLGVRGARRPQARQSPGTRSPSVAEAVAWASVALLQAGPAAPLLTPGVPGAPRRGPEPRLTACLAPAWGSWRAGPVSVLTSQSHWSPPGQERRISGRADTGYRSTALLESGWPPLQALHAQGRDLSHTHPGRVSR